jgi:hypothetical protein
MRASTTSARPAVAETQSAVLSLSVEGVEVDLLFDRFLDTGHVAVGHRLEERGGLLVRLVGSLCGAHGEARHEAKAPNGFAWSPLAKSART